MTDPADCPECNGWVLIEGRWVKRRETSGLVCQRCGRDYGASDGDESRE